MSATPELIEKARREGKWIRSPYQNIWFSPDELEVRQTNGEFRWGERNFELRDPQEMLEALAKTIKRAEKEYIEFKQRMSGAFTK